MTLTEPPGPAKVLYSTPRGSAEETMKPMHEICPLLAICLLLGTATAWPSPGVDHQTFVLGVEGMT